MLARAEDLLRAERRHAVGTVDVPWLELLALLAAGSAVYGVVLGSWSARPLQASYSAVKVPLLLALTTFVCLPSFYVLNAALGLAADFRPAVRGVLAAQATLGVALAGAAPLTAFAYVSGCSYPGATLFNGGVFLTGTMLAQWTLGRHYRPLVARDPRHRVALGAWLVLYAFVAIQLAWTLRPFVGYEEMPTTFLRPESFTNAYVDAVEAMRRAR